MIEHAEQKLRQVYIDEASFDGLLRSLVCSLIHKQRQSKGSAYSLLSLFSPSGWLGLVKLQRTWRVGDGGEAAATCQ